MKANDELVYRFRQFDSRVLISYSQIAKAVLGADYWMVAEAFIYYIGSMHSGRYVLIPKGYLTDGASVPRPLWWLIPPWGKYGAAVIVHDFLCETLTIIVDGKPVRITREEADHILKEALDVLGVNKYISAIIYGGVSFYRKVFNVSGPQYSDAKRDLEDTLRLEMERGNNVV